MLTLAENERIVQRRLCGGRMIVLSESHVVIIEFATVDEKILPIVDCQRAETRAQFARERA